MRVLHVIDSLALAGAEVLVRDLAIRGARLGLDTSVYALVRTESPLEKDLEQAGVPFFSPCNASVYSPRQVWDLARHLGTHRYDVVHVHLFPAQLWVAAAVRSLGRHIPTLVTTEHNTENRRRRWWWRPLDAWFYAAYAHVACIGEATERNLVAWMPSLRGLTSVIPNGIALDRFSRAEPAVLHGIPPGLRIACVGRLQVQKDHETLVRAVAKVEGAQLVLVGDGELREPVEALARELGMRDRLHLLGLRSDVPAILKAVDVYVQPSRWEGFGIAALEAMAAGLPIVVSDVQGLGDVVGDAGLKFPVGCWESLRDRLRELSADPNVRTRLGALAAARARRWDIETTAERYRDLYRRLSEE